LAIAAAYDAWGLRSAGGAGANVMMLVEIGTVISNGS
jgi:hypothetical protein